MDPTFRGPYANVNRWFVTIVNQPQFKKVIGEVKLCTTMAKFDRKQQVILSCYQRIVEFTDSLTCIKYIFSLLN